MKKLIEQLTTSEFVAVILGVSPKIELEFNAGFGPYRKYVGTYDEILSAIRADRGLISSYYYNYAIECLFDYDMQLSKTDITKYLRDKTDGFDPDLTTSLLEDLADAESKLMHEIEPSFPSPEEFEQWKKKALAPYKRTINFLKRKCGCLEPQGLIESSVLNSAETSDTGGGASDIVPLDIQKKTEKTEEDKAQNPNHYSPRIAEHLDKAKNYIINGRWHNNDKKEYAIFLRALHCKLYHKQWNNNIIWKKIPVLPLENGSVPTRRDFTNAMRKYDETSDAHIRIQFEELLNR